MRKKSKLFLAFGLLIVAAGLYLVISMITPPGYEKTAGVIINIDPDSAVPQYEREIKFTTREGKTYVVHDRSYSNAKRTSNDVTVAYDPNNPEKTMRVIADGSRSVLWGAIVVLAGSGLIYAGFRKPSQEDGPNLDSPPARQMRTKKSSK